MIDSRTGSLFVNNERICIDRLYLIQRFAQCSTYMHMIENPLILDAPDWFDPDIGLCEGELMDLKNYYQGQYNGQIVVFYINKFEQTDVHGRAIIGGRVAAIAAEFAETRTFSHELTHITANDNFDRLLFNERYLILFSSPAPGNPEEHNNRCRFTGTQEANIREFY